MSFKLIILGSSGALPAYGRFPSSQHLTIQNHHFLIDCGEGCQLQLARFGLSIHKISHIFVSHLHGDHYLGITGLIFSMHLNRRESDLHIHAFRGLEEILLAQLRHSRTVLNFRIIFCSLNEGVSEMIFEDLALTVETIPLEHKIPTSGFLFREKQKELRLDKSKLKSELQPTQIQKLKRGEDVLDENNRVLYKSSEFTLAPRPSYSYAYCSDCQPSASMAARISGVDLLYHEATFLEDEKVKARETKHSTAAEAALTAKEAGVKKLIIGHFSARYRDLGVVLEEARKIFPNTTLAIEGEGHELEV